MLEFAQGYLSYLIASGKRKYADDKRRVHELLIARSWINQVSSPSEVLTPEVRPVAGIPKRSNERRFAIAL